MTKRTRIEFGDFQTPRSLADAVCQKLSRGGVRPAAIVEPTCGQGTFIAAALRAFPEVQSVRGVEANGQYVCEAKQRVYEAEADDFSDIRHADFFDTDWEEVLARLPRPVLIIGNPPWVTNSQQGAIGGQNLPPKRNSGDLSGIAAMTGKSNFDIAEWMVWRLIEVIGSRDVTLAMLCKTSVARKVVTRCWREDMPLRCSVHRIDAQREFDAAVDACLLTTTHDPTASRECAVFETLDDHVPSSIFGLVGEQLVSNVPLFRQQAHLAGTTEPRWRSGIKHDCARVLELRRVDNEFRNGLDEVVRIEPACVYPMLKGSQIAHGDTDSADRWMIVPQQRIGQDTSDLRDRAPHTWNYLTAHGERLDGRGSSIYRNRPRFSIFGVGDYTFAPWKIAIAGLYKQLTFRKVGPRERRPVVFDDTCYFQPCASEDEADRLLELLNSPAAQAFYSSLIFWDTKRPITADILNRLSLQQLRTSLTPV